MEIDFINKLIGEHGFTLATAIILLFYTLWRCNKLESKQEETDKYIKTTLQDMVLKSTTALDRCYSILEKK